MTSKKRMLEGLKLNGVNEDIPPQLLPPDVYSSVKNFEPFDIGMRSSRGNGPAFPGALFDPEYLAYNKAAAEFYWLYASGAGIGVTDGQNHFDITPAVGVSSVWPTSWTDALLNNLVVLNNNVDPPVWWSNEPSSPMEVLPGWPAGWTARAIRSFNYNLIAMDITDGASQFISKLAWSDSSEGIPDSWTPLPENSAGDNVLADSIGALVDGLQARSSFMIFKEHSTYLMDYIGGNFVFAFRKLFTTSGMLTTGCGAEYLGNAFILTDGDFITTDGQTATSLIDKRMRQWLFNNIDADNYQLAHVVSYHSENQVWCCFPELGESECTLALVWDASDNKFGVRELQPATSHVCRGQVGNVTGVISWDDDNESWDSDNTSWNASLYNPTEDSLIQADRTGRVLYAVNQGNTYGGEVIDSKLERLGLDFGTVEYTKLVYSLIPRIYAAAGTELIIRVGASANDANQVVWQPAITYIHGTTQKIDVFAQGRFIAFSIESAVEQEAFTIYGVEFGVELQGRY